MEAKDSVRNAVTLMEAAGVARQEFSDALLWWRGLPDEKYELIPGVLRDDNFIRRESDIIQFFMNRASTRYDNCPDFTDIQRWLFLMQHFRLPTRLLDWTESILIAAYFAVNSEKEKTKDKNGVIYALWPGKLNQICEGLKKENQTLNPYYEPASGIIRACFDRSRPDETKILAIQTIEIDIRMMVQKSKFTLHGSHEALERHSGRDAFLLKFTIPSETKSVIRNDLFYMGYLEGNVFPDLDHLASELRTLTGEGR